MKVLAIIDMQNDFLTGPLGNKECESTIEKIVEHINTNDYDFVVLTRDTHNRDYLQTQEGKNLPVEHCIEGTEGWRINSDIMDAVKANFSDVRVRILDKPTFGSTDFGAWLLEADRNYHDLEITFVGVCTGICVISNVALAKAFVPEAKLRVVADCCACVTPQTHQTALNAMQNLQVEII